MRKISIALVIALCGGLTGVAVAGCSDEEREQVELSVSERDLTPARVVVADREIEFVVKNDGERRHVFAVETPDGIERTDEIEPGEEGRLSVTLPEGRYRMYDPLGDYRARGVRGTVVVDLDDDSATVTERTVTERTVEEETEERPDVEDPPVTVTERQVQPPPRNRPRSPQPQPQPQPTPPPPEQVPEEPPPSSP